LSLLGSVPCPRAYYYCRRCGQGVCPWDQAVGLTEKNLTPGLERVATLAGAVADSFERGAELLEEMSGIRLGESTVQRTTEATGRRVAAAYQQGRTFGPKVDWRWHVDAKGRRCAYVSVDATGVRQQGPEGGKADGRMAYLGMIYNPVPPPERVPPDPGQPRPPMQARYVCGLYPLADLGPLLRRQGAQVGMDRAELWLALTDGGSGLEDFVLGNFPRVEVVILDFWHAAEYLADLAKALYPKDDEQAQAQTRQWCQLLKEEGGAAMTAVLREWDWPPRQPAVRAQLARVLEYFGNNVHRMEYPEYLAEGWQIGSGAVESGCKTVVGQRLKGAGMRWGEDGAHAVCHVRALYRSEKGQWEAFWNRQLTN
jgi:hypothetical protein